MSEYITKDAILNKTVNKNRAWLYTTNAEGKNLKEIVDELPSADVRLNIHGHWIATPECDTCSECHFKVVAGFNFCPRCGADMREPKGKEQYD